MLVQVAYAIGEPQPVSFYVNTYGTARVDMTDAQIAQWLQGLFDMTPAAIEQRLQLRMPIYEETAAYGHMGREPRRVVKEFCCQYEVNRTIEVELFTWEKLDQVDRLRRAFGL